jgi:hypothetical protein
MVPSCKDCGTVIHDPDADSDVCDTCLRKAYRERGEHLAVIKSLEKCVVMLLPGAKHLAIDIGFLNDTLIKSSRILKGAHHG